MQTCTGCLLDVRAELGVRQVRVARARGVQVEEEGVLAVLGERLERGAQPAQDAALVRRAVEVDAWVGAGLGLEET